jgi:hypothetical protein
VPRADSSVVSMLTAPGAAHRVRPSRVGRAPQGEAIAREGFVASFVRVDGEAE